MSVFVPFISAAGGSIARCDEWLLAALSAPSLKDLRSEFIAASASIGVGILSEALTAVPDFDVVLPTPAF